jgi:CHAT domain-containing protein
VHEDTNDRVAKVSKRTGTRTSQDLLAQIWRDITKPIITALGLKRLGSASAKRPGLHWCPTGLFAFVPLHAAGSTEFGSNWCSDYVVSSYTPTLSALVQARKGIRPISLKSIKALLVSAPTSPGLPRLENAVEEIRSVSSLLSFTTPTVVDGGHPGYQGATMDEVIFQLSGATILHLACHGQQVPEQPLESGFCMSDGILTVSSLMRLNLPNAVFAFLSACETAKGDQKQPNQAVHLAAAMLFVGFRSIIATMWCVLLLTSHTTLKLTLDTGP